MTGRIAQAFARAREERRPALVAYLMAGEPAAFPFVAHGLSAAAAAEPDPQRDLAYAKAVLAEADVLEIGVPFSDPVADGPTIERAATRALARGVKAEHALALAKTLRAESDKPILLMTYYNPILQRGLDAFAAACKAHGVDGLIVPDVPLEESGPVSDALAEEGLALVQLASPATPPERLARLAKATRGFLYVVSSFGVTGARDALPPEAVEVVQRAAKACEGVTPFAVGFGVSKPEHAKQLHEAGAPGVVVGSAIVGRIEQGASAEDVRAFVRGLRG